MIHVIVLMVHQGLSYFQNSNINDTYNINKLFWSYRSSLKNGFFIITCVNFDQFDQFRLTLIHTKSFSMTYLIGSLEILDMPAMPSAITLNISCKLMSDTTLWSDTRLMTLCMLLINSPPEVKISDQFNWPSSVDSIWN